MESSWVFTWAGVSVVAPACLRDPENGLLLEGGDEKLGRGLMKKK